MMRGDATETMSTTETMGRSKRPRRSYTKEFKAEVVELVTEVRQWRSRELRDLILIRDVHGCSPTCTNAESTRSAGVSD
jgi:hypothetical protein